MNTINDLPNEPASAQRAQSAQSRTNAQKRPREHLTPAEVDAMIAAARTVGRYGARDAALILIAYRHGLRVSELCALTWAHVDAAAGLLTVWRAKGGYPGTHPIRPVVAAALRALRPMKGESAGYLFQGERGPLKPRAVRKIVARAGVLAGLPFTVHPHMLRHGCGYALADQGMDVRTIQLYLGHRRVNTTLIYTAASPRALDKCWLD